MLDLLQSTLSGARLCHPHQGLGKALMLVIFEGRFRFNGGDFISKDINTGICVWIDPDQQTQSGRCRAILTPT
uniref:Uncharacterized protein n=1 Tax=Cyanothece sp. (strain PCC 7425 / ATCC 29141) TaxID=395961 RepID=B8HX24_CYAP4